MHIANHRGISLPLFHGVSAAEANYVTDIIKN